MHRPRGVLDRKKARSLVAWSIHKQIKGYVDKWLGWQGRSWGKGRVGIGVGVVLRSCWAASSWSRPSCRCSCPGCKGMCGACVGHCVLLVQLPWLWTGEVAHMPHTSHTSTTHPMHPPHFCAQLRHACTAGTLPYGGPALVEAWHPTRCPCHTMKLRLGGGPRAANALECSSGGKGTKCQGWCLPELQADDSCCTEEGYGMARRVSVTSRGGAPRVVGAWGVWKSPGGHTHTYTHIHGVWKSPGGAWHEVGPWQAPARR